MPFINEDVWVNGQAATHELSELEDTAIGVDATYWLGTLLDSPNAHEPLLPALGGLTGIEIHINESLDQWAQHRITPFFIFDGQSLTGQDDVSLRQARAANRKTDEAWKLYSQTEAEQAVSTFGANPGAFRIQRLYPLLQRTLKARGLHFLVAPYNAAAQLAYFEIIDSDQCAGVLGSQELLLYPIKDCVIRSLDFEAKSVSAISKKRVMHNLHGVSESMFIDALLMAGTSFLPPFPPLEDTSIYQNPSTIMDAVNILRTADKAVANAAASFNDILLAQDPDWLDKYRRARMTVHHLIYISESGEVQVNDFDHLTSDNHEYLGLQMPAELLHYLNTGLIGARLLNCITHNQMLVQPTLDGEASDEYKKLVIDQIAPIREQALSLILPRIHRVFGHKMINVRVWFDKEYSLTINPRSLQSVSSQQAGTWDVKERDIRQFFPADFAGPIYLEVLALANPDFVAKTTTKEKSIRGIDTTEMITSITIWRFLHVRGYVNDAHKLTNWGNALATTLLALKDASENRPEVPGVEEAALLAFELIRLGVLKGKYREDQPGMPRKGNNDDRCSVVLISQCATLLKLRHQVYGYTGPLNRALLTFRALSSTVREADRDLIDAIVASMFMYGQSRRERDDYLDISHRLPFLQEPDIGLGIAISTFFDDDEATDGQDARSARLKEFPKTYVPYAEALADDFQAAIDLVRSVNQGVQTLDNEQVSEADKMAWKKAQAYLDARPF